jgi:dolichyl-diphosphooligosaccharide--protein glycosyltransferase
MRETFAWIRDHTPPTDSYSTPTRSPEYGVICMPDYAMWLVSYAQRPSVSGPWLTFQSEDRERTADVFRFLLAENETDANDLADRNSVRYIVASHLLFGLRDFADIAGLDPDRYMTLTRNPARGRSVYRVTDSYERLMGVRLHAHDGVTPAPDGPPSLQRYRLLYESEPFTDVSTGNPTDLKVFEYVKGARLTGRTMPHTAVRAEVSIETNRGRKFPYATDTEADADGAFTLTVPYPTSAAPDKTHAVSKYRVNALAVDVFADVIEADVAEGREVKISFPAASRH